MSRIWISLSLVALVAAAVLTARDALRPEPTNVIVITVESWRADAATPERMPHLFEAARQGVTFAEHRAVSAWTGPNVIAVLTGVSPFRQGVHARGHSMDPDHVLFPEVLAARGWHVGGVQAFMLIDLFENLGFTFEPGSGLFEWVSRHGRTREPFFAWYHYVDSHLPYDPSGADSILAAFPEDDPAAQRRREQVRLLPVIPAGELDLRAADRPWVEALYRGGFDDFDAWFARFWAFFEQSGLDRNTILVVTADHGEELLERGNVGHASTTRVGHLHEEIVRVPLFLWAPERLLPVPRGTVEREMTDHLMIAPALAGMLGLEDGFETDSSGLFADPRRPVWTGVTSGAGFSEPDPDDVRRYIAAMREGDLKVQVTTEDGRPVAVEAWNLARDPDARGRPRPGDEAVENLAAGLLARLRDMTIAPVPRAGVGVARATAVPDWIHPAASRPVGHADIAGRTYLEWSGDPEASYVLQYEAGAGLLALSGTLDAVGTRYDFAPVGEGYWTTWIVPYDLVRFRVRRADAPEAWSAWIELELQP